jgi:excisionase family DNA binding protein
MREETFTTTEAAEILGVRPARVRQMILAGFIEAEKRGRDLLIPKSQIEKAKARKKKPGPVAQAESEITPSGRSKRKARAKNIPSVNKKN